MSGTYGVFILESLSLEDEQENRLDGYHLRQMLDLMKVPNEYYFIRTKIELDQIKHEFRRSRLRYLHLSCHGNDDSIGLAFDVLGFQEFDDLLGPFLGGKRLFLSACNLATFDFAQWFIPRHQCLSIIGTPDKPGFAESASFWGTFYFLMNKRDPERMTHRTLIEILEKCSHTYEMNLNYFSRIPPKKKNSNSHLRAIEFHSGNVGPVRILKVSI
jgi:hypothetical protein